MDIIGFSRNTVCTFFGPVLLWYFTETGNLTVLLTFRGLWKDTETFFGYLFLCFQWVSYIKWETQDKDVWEQGTEEDMWT